MFRLFLVLFLFFSFFTEAGQYRLSQNASFSTYLLVPAGTLCGSNIEECLNVLPATVNYSGTGNVDFNKSNNSSVSVSGTTSTVTVYYRKYNKYSAYVPVTFKASYVDDGFLCSDREECFFYANNLCESESKLLTDFQYIGTPADNFNHSCSDEPKDPADKCQDEIIQQCANSLDMASYNYIDNGDGTTSCTGTCNDGTDAEEQCIPSVANNYCDVADEPSDLDFSAGNFGTSGDSSSSNSTGPDTEHEVDYTPDGSGTSSSENGGMSSLQGDKLINEVVKSRNDNTETLTFTTDKTNETIVEKTDDIQKTISNSANGIIDAVNNATPFYDGNIVDAINGLNTGGEGLDDTGIINAIDGLSDRFDVNHESQGFPSEASAWGQGMFGTPKIEHLQSLTVDLKTAIDTENETFKTTLNSYVHFSSHDNGYQVNNLELGQWGSHDISISRFSEYFGGVANIVYFFAALTALGIVLGGVKS